VTLGKRVAWHSLQVRSVTDRGGLVHLRLPDEALKRAMGTLVQGWAKRLTSLGKRKPSEHLPTLADQSMPK